MKCKGTFSERKSSNFLKERLKDVIFIRTCAINRIAIDLSNFSKDGCDSLYIIQSYAVKTSHLTASRIPAILPLRDSALETSCVDVRSWEPNTYTQIHTYAEAVVTPMYTAVRTPCLLFCLPHWLRSSISGFNRWDKRRFVRQRYGGER